MPTDSSAPPTDSIGMMNAREIDWLLEELCTTLGCCLPRAAQERLLTAPPPTPEAFAIAVVRADNLDHEVNDTIYQAVLAMVRRAFQRSAARVT